jgi:hypothetical protein
LISKLPLRGLYTTVAFGLTDHFYTLAHSDLKVDNSLVKPFESHLLNTILCRRVHITHRAFILNCEFDGRLVELPYRFVICLAQVPERVDGLLGLGKEARVLK